MLGKRCFTSQPPNLLKSGQQVRNSPSGNQKVLGKLRTADQVSPIKKPYRSFCKALEIRGEDRARTDDLLHAMQAL